MYVVFPNRILFCSESATLQKGVKNIFGRVASSEGVSIPVKMSSIATVTLLALQTKVHTFDPV